MGRRMRGITQDARKKKTNDSQLRPSSGHGEPSTETSFTPQTDPTRIQCSVHFRGQSPRPRSPHRVQPLTPGGASAGSSGGERASGEQVETSSSQCGPHGAVPGLDPVRAGVTTYEQAVDETRPDPVSGTLQSTRGGCTAVPKQDVPGCTGM